MSQDESRSRTVLVVDDEPLVLRMVTQILEHAGYGVLMASGGKEALRVYSSSNKPIDLVVTDVSMPEMNGAQLAVCIEEKQPGVPILFMTGYASEAAFKGIMELHPDFHDCAVLQKPFTPKQLRELVRDLIEGERLYEAISGG